ncbi:hypothetical protein [Pectobacterium brasiliense]|uniref:hypothetical protein n=1 Tax=Pectobacterium brasiliense TaxID=180957 RepID=UPI0005806F97|nr:hypothetical protein [Pectobacterium brasiliense]KHT21033.1 hypothetical protein RC97_02995 [Pectobacterium brasiliense]
MDNNLYAERDIIQLDVSGNFYCQHVHHMTSESLDSKSDIAAELGYRDFCISELQKDNETLRAMMSEVEIQRDGLVAENAALKHAISEINNSAEEVEHDGYLTFVINPDCLHCAVDLIENENPATDAAIAEIGAKAIRDCAESLLANDDIGVEHEYPLMLSYADKLRGGGSE